MFNWFDFINSLWSGSKGKHAGEVKASRSPEFQAAMKSNAETKRERRRTRNFHLVVCGGMSAAREEEV
jgi:hypothetical protein